MQKKIRRIIVVLLAVAALATAIFQAAPNDMTTRYIPPATSGEAATALELLEVKGRAPKTGYSREQFGDGWGELNGCDMRNTILVRDLSDEKFVDDCKVQSGVLNDPYTGMVLAFDRSRPSDIQIDHVVALSDAWQKGAQQLSLQQRTQFANDPLELLAVDGEANQQKADSDAASWLPPNKTFRCEYVSRQIAIKRKYALWVTEAEKNAMLQVLSACPGQQLPAA